MKKLLSIALSLLLAVQFVPAYAFAEIAGDPGVAMQDEPASGVESKPALTAGASSELGLIAGIAETVEKSASGLHAQDVEGAEGEQHEFAGKLIEWTDSNTMVKYAAYVTNSKEDGDGIATAALYSIRYVGDEPSSYEEAVTLENGSLEVTVPSTIEDYVIDELGTKDYGIYDYLLYDYEIGKITVPSSVSKVNEFQKDGYLRELIFDSGCNVTEIPDNFISQYYLSKASALTRVVLPDSVERIGRHAFRRNFNLSSINMPSSLKSIDDFAFAETHLSSITFSNSLETIGTGAFASNTYEGSGLTETAINIPDSVISIGDYAFAYVGSIGWYGGEYCFGEFPSKSTSPITSVAFGNSLESIGAYAFADSQIASLELPASLTNLGEGAFLRCANLERVTWSNLDSANIESIGADAFYDCEKLQSFSMPVTVTSIDDDAFGECYALRDISIPPGLKSLGTGAFQNCKALETVTIPGSLKEFGEGGFSGCTALDDLTLNEGLTTIGARAFTGCTSLKSVIIPRSVSLIDQGAFGAWDSAGRTAIESLTILGGDKSLTIASEAFANCTGLNGKTIDLPKRVYAIGGGALAFIENANFVIHNPNIKFDGTDMQRPYYLYTDTTDVDFARIYYADPSQAWIDDNGAYSIRIPDPWASDVLTVSKTLPKPNGSVVRYPSTLTRDTSPTFWGYLQAWGKDVQEYGSADSIRPTFEAAEIPEEEADETELVEVAAAGRLKVTTKGSAGTTANVCVYDASGNLAASAQAQSGFALFTGLESGTYTVVTFAKNGYFSAVGSLVGFADLGVDSNQYAQGAVTIKTDEDVEIDLNVPKMTISPDSSVQSSSVAMSKQQTYKEQTFYATVNFRMAEGKTASTLKVKLPAGLTPTSVSSTKKNYGNYDYNYSNRTLTVSLDNEDAQTGKIYVGLRASATGRHVVSASVVADRLTVPIGNAAITVSALSLELPTEPVKDKKFTVTVHAAPNTDVTLQAAGREQTVTANKAGTASATFDLSSSDTTLSYAIVVATAKDGDADVTETGMVEFEATQTSVATLQDFTFIHADKQYYIVQSGRTQPPSRYYTYVANGKEANKYWTFTATYTSTKQLWNQYDLTQVIKDPVYANARVQMLDGSSRYQELSPISSKKQDDETYLTTFAGTLYLEQAGDHVFPTSLVPCAFDVTLHLPDEMQAERTQTDIDTIRKRKFESLADWNLRREKTAKLLLNVNDIPAWEDDGDNYFELSGDDSYDYWASNVDYSWVFFYNWTTETDEYYTNAVTEGLITEADYKSVKTNVETLKNRIDVAGQVLDDMIGATKPMAECESFTDWLVSNYDVPLELDFDGDTLASEGWDVVSDNNAESANAGGVVGGTPTAGIEGTGFAEPTQYATKTTLGSDGSVQSVQYRDSNGNGATIPVGKALDNFANFDVKVTESGSNWVGYAKEATSIATIDYETTTKLILGIDLTIYNSLPTGSEARKFFDEHCASRYLRHGEIPLTGANWALTFYDNYKKSEAWQEYYKNAAEARGNVDNLEIRLNYLRMHNKVGTPCWKALVNERDWAIIAADGLAADRDWNVFDTLRGAAFDVLGFVGDKAAGPAGSAVAYAGDKITGKAVSDRIDANKRILNPALANLNAAHQKRLEDCGDDNKDAPNNVTPILDPSGIVYEAFPGNVLEGVTATVYQVTGEGTDASTDNPWAADEYDQVNPQITGEDGYFGWDVPEGSWQVKFTKDGYDGTQTKTLQVPPPQVGLEISMVSQAAPEVVSATADTKTIEIEFSQYMKADITSTSGVTLQVNGASVNSSQLSWKDSETATTGTFSKVLVAPVPTNTKLGDKLSVSLSGVKNYAGRGLASEYARDITVAARPAKLVFNFDETISLQTGTSRATSVRVYDAEDKPLQGVKLNASLNSNIFAKVNADNAMTDDEGIAKLQIEAVLPGMSELTVQAAGTPLSQTINLLTTADTNKAARPTARIVDDETGELIKSISSGAPAENTVYINKSAKMYVYSATEGATIYYTLDGSCPCQKTDGRSAYEEDDSVGLSLNGNSTADYILAAYKDGMDYSERLKVYIRVGDPSLNGDVKEDPGQTGGNTSGNNGTNTGGNNTNTGGNNTNTGGNKNNNTGTATNTSGNNTNGNSNNGGSTGNTNGNNTSTGTNTQPGGNNGSTGASKKDNPMQVSSVKQEALFKKVKKKATTVACPVIVTGAQGAVTYSKVSGSSALTINKNTGKVTIKKKSKKGTYTIKIQVTAAGNASYKAKSETLTCKVAVVNKLANTITVTPVDRAASLAKVKKKAATVARPLKVSKAKGKVTYAKASGAKALKVNKKTGKVTVKKGTKAGVYTIKIKVTAAGNSTYKKLAKKVACKVIVG